MYCVSLRSVRARGRDALTHRSDAPLQTIKERVNVRDRAHFGCHWISATLKHSINMGMCISHCICNCFQLEDARVMIVLIFIHLYLSYCLFCITLQKV